MKTHHRSVTDVPVFQWGYQKYEYDIQQKKSSLLSQN